MNITGPLPNTAALSILKSAIKQPELALELLARTIDSMSAQTPSAQKVQEFAEPVLSASAIDIKI